jgi:hypothetical protein
MMWLSDIGEGKMQMDMNIRENEVGGKRRTVCVFAHLLSGEDRHMMCEEKTQ